jgi:hypothetical protein
MFLIAEYCDSPYYMGWHLYFRDSKLFKRNKDGDWGWIHRPRENAKLKDFLLSLGIVIRGDGTCDDDGIAKFAKMFPLNGKKCGGKVRGGVEININEKIELKIKSE